MIPATTRAVRRHRHGGPEVLRACSGPTPSTCRAPEVHDPQVREPQLHEPHVRGTQVREPQVHDPQVHDPQIRDRKQVAAGVGGPRPVREGSHPTGGR